MRRRVALLTFGAGLPNWRGAALRLGKQALESHWFTSVSVLTDRDLRNDFPQFWMRHADLLKPNIRGFGFWIWKPFVIAETLCQLRGKADVLLYLDAGHELNLAPPALDRLADYSELTLSESGLFAMSIRHHPEWKWTKADVLEATGLPATDRATDQLQAHPFLRIDQANIDFCRQWLAVCEFDGYRLLDDSGSHHPNPPGFREHRHDQSIFSSLAKKVGCQTIPDETFWAPNWQEIGESYPIWAARNRSRFPTTRTGPWSVIGRAFEKSYSRLWAKATWERNART